LGECISNSLTKFEELESSSIAFPALSTGNYGFPRDKTAEIIIQKCIEYIAENHERTKIKLIKFVNLEAFSVRAFKDELEKQFQSASSINSSNIIQNISLNKNNDDSQTESSQHNDKFQAQPEFEDKKEEENGVLAKQAEEEKKKKEQEAEAERVRKE